MLLVNISISGNIYASSTKKNTHYYDYAQYLVGTIVLKLEDTGYTDEQIKQELQNTRIKYENKTQLGSYSGINKIKIDMIIMVIDKKINSINLVSQYNEFPVPVSQ